jgi:comEA protein
MFRALVIKLALLALTIAVILGLGWPVPQVETPAPGPFKKATVPSLPPVSRVGPSSAWTVARVDVNRASVEELEILPHVGPVLAERIVEWRRQHGRYRSVDDLQAVKGIGKKRLEQLRPLVTVQP